jgi:hypothetical protein
MTVAATKSRVRLHWGAAIALVYGAFATSTLAFVAFALSQPVDLVSADYYARSLRQDVRLAAVQRADALGPALACAPSADGKSLDLRIPPTATRAAVGTLTLYRAADGRADRVLPLRLNPDGVQRVSLEDLARGRWTVQVNWRVADADYYREWRLDLR